MKDYTKLNKNKHADTIKGIVLVVAVLVLIAAGTYYYSAVYVPAQQQAEQINNLTN